MPTTALVEQRNWLRLPLSIPASLTLESGKRILDASILDISINGVGFTVDANIHGPHELAVSFWLPFDDRHPNDATLEPVSARLALVASRYAADFQTYAYGAVLVGLKPSMRREIETYLARVTAVLPELSRAFPESG